MAGDVPPDFKCSQGAPGLEESRVSTMGSGKVVSLTTGWDGSEFPLGTVPMQRGGARTTLSTRETGSFLYSVL